MPHDISSPRNARVKLAVRLRDRRAREKQRRLIVDGVREIGRALAGGIEIVELYVCLEWVAGDECDGLIERARQSGAAVFSVTPDVAAKLSFGNRSEGVVAVAHAPRRELSDLSLADSSLIVVLEGIEKPGNVGAIVRTADGAGDTAVVVADGGTDLFNPNAIRASLGAIFSLPVCAATSAETKRWLNQHGLQIIVTRVDARPTYDQLDLTRPTAIVLGSESGGLSSAWLDVGTAVRLPMEGTVDSLNVSATAAVLLYEANRQRRSNAR